MASDAQILANRANAQQSTGPRTPEGKAISAANALDHGLTAKKYFVLPTEEPAEYQALLADLTRHYDPRSPVEIELVAQISAAQWQRARVSTILRAAYADPDPDPAFILKFGRYEQSLLRGWRASRKDLLRENTLRASALKTLAEVKAKADPAFLARMLTRLAAEAEKQQSNPIATPGPPESCTSLTGLPIK